MLKRPLLIATIFGMAVFSTSVFAADADVCYSTPSPNLSNRITSKTSLNCPIAGAHTLPELARAGWTIVTILPWANAADPAHYTTAWMVVIEKK